MLTNRWQVISRTLIRHAFLALVLVAAFGVAGCSNQPGTIKGTVTREADGQPVAQAEVIVYALNKVEGAGSVDVFTKGTVLQTVVTDTAGVFSVSLGPGKNMIEARSEGLAAADRLIEVKAGRTTTVDFSLVASPP